MLVPFSTRADQKRRQPSDSIWTPAKFLILCLTFVQWMFARADGGCLLSITINYCSPEDRSWFCVQGGSNDRHRGTWVWGQCCPESSMASDRIANCTMHGKSRRIHQPKLAVKYQPKSALGLSINHHHQDFEWSWVQQCVTVFFLHPVIRWHQGAPRKSFYQIPGCGFEVFETLSFVFFPLQVGCRCDIRQVKEASTELIAQE